YAPIEPSRDHRNQHSFPTRRSSDLAFRGILKVRLRNPRSVVSELTMNGSGVRPALEDMTSVVQFEYRSAILVLLNISGWSSPCWIIPKPSRSCRKGVDA